MLFVTFAVAAATTVATTRARAQSPCQSLQVDPWGADSFRIRCNLDSQSAYNGVGALEEAAPATPGPAPADPTGKGPWLNGNMKIEFNDDQTALDVSRDGTKLATLDVGFQPKVQVTRWDKATGKPKPPHPDNDLVNLTTLTIDTEGQDISYFGFGEHENGKLDQIGLTYDMETCIEYTHSRGGEICLPWVLTASDLGAGKQVQFGAFWNVPAYGSASFGATKPASNVWTAHNIDQADLFITTFAKGADTKTHAAANSILNHYVDAVGHAPPLPDWAAGYWHSKNRYSNEAEVLNTMEIFEKNYSIPVAVFVVDYFNWAVMGNLTFDPAHWPDPKAMVNKLKSDGTKIMVSTWPFSQGKSKTFKPLQEHGYAVYTNGTATDSVDWPDGVCGHPCYLYDASNPDARSWWWNLVQSGYFDYGIEIFWLDAAEPEQMGGSPPGSQWAAGTFERTGMMFPYFHTQTYHDGMSAAGSTDHMMLSRSAWAGMSKHRAALWNGDTSSKYSYLKTAVQAGQSVQLSGIAWWTTDIGGYGGGNPADPMFRELIVRWFQFGFTSPIFRQHGARNTEPWLLGNESMTMVFEVMAMRETFKPYVLAELNQTANTGLPLNRPLWFDAPSDANAWKVDDQFMFGRDYMIAPIYVEHALNRSVYFPAGASWTHHFTGKIFKGGSTAIIHGPLNEFPFFKKAGAAQLA